MSKKLSLVLFLSWQLMRADTPGIRVVNGASFMQDTSLAPGAIISIFGSSLANTTATAPDFSNLPTTLGNVTVSIGSTQLPLFFVTATQINGYVLLNGSESRDPEGLALSYKWTDNGSVLPSTSEQYETEALKPKSTHTFFQL